MKPVKRKKSLIEKSARLLIFANLSTMEHNELLFLAADVNAVSSSSAAAAAGHEAAISDKLYCICQCPHDDVSEMIGCDAPDCRLEWFHFECVGILVPPKGQWFCPECRERYKIKSKNYW